MARRRRATNVVNHESPRQLRRPRPATAPPLPESAHRRRPHSWTSARTGCGRGEADAPARSELMAARRATHSAMNIAHQGWRASRVRVGSAGCRDHGLGGLVQGSDAWVLTASEQRRLPCRSGGSGRGSCGPARRIPTSGSLWRDSRAWITAGTRDAGVLSVMAWITSPRTRGSGSSASSSNLVHTRSSSARTWQVHRFLHASWRARLCSLRDRSSSPSIASLTVRPSQAGRPTPACSTISLHRPTAEIERFSAGAWGWRRPDIAKA